MTSKRKRWLIGLPIVAFWLLMTGLLLDRELGGPTRLIELDQAGRLQEPTESWMGLFVGGTDNSERRRIGYVHLQQIPESRYDLSGVTMRVTLSVELNMFGRSTDLDLNGVAWRSYVGRRADLDFEVTSAASSETGCLTCMRVGSLPVWENWNRCYLRQVCVQPMIRHRPCSPK